VTALTALTELDESCSDRGVQLCLCSLRQRPRDMITQSGLGRRFAGRLFVTLDEAVAALGKRS
jgi:anti-anti-sigma regulatory factor